MRLNYCEARLFDNFCCDDTLSEDGHVMLGVLECFTLIDKCPGTSVLL